MNSEERARRLIDEHLQSLEQQGAQAIATMLTAATSTGVLGISIGIFVGWWLWGPR